MAEADEAPELGLRDYLSVLRRRRGIIALAVVVVVAVTLIASFLQTPVYEATAEVLIQTSGSSNLFNPSTAQPDAARALQTQIQVLNSQPVRDAVKKQLGRAPNVSVAEVAQTDIIEVKAQSTDPKQAATVANAYANAYIKFRQTQAVNDLLAAAAQIQAKVADLQKQIDALNVQLTAGTPADQALARQNLGPQRDALVTQQSAFKQQLDQLQVNGALQTGGAQLVTPATAPSSPIKPRPKRNAVIAVAVGLIFGIGVAFLLEYLDDSIKTKDDLDRASAGMPNLGLIPLASGAKNATRPEVVSISAPTSAAAEAYRSLRTSVQFLGLDQPVRALQLTSPGAAEGKTTTVANLGVALARAGQSVCLVCCDLRRPKVHEFFGLSNSIGLTSVLLGEVPLASAVQEVPAEEHLAVLPSGPVPPDPSELLSSPRIDELIDDLRKHFDIVLFDSPPVLPVTDAAVLSRRMDAIVLVATAGVTTRRELGRAIELLRQVDAPLVGTVLNGTTDQGGYGYSRGTYRYYGSTQSPRGSGANGAATNGAATNGSATNGAGAKSGRKSHRRSHAARK